MTLVDTSVWIDYFRRGNEAFTALLLKNDVLMHPFVMGELSLGRLSNRREIMDLLGRLPAAPLADHKEVLHCAETNKLGGSGIGWIDAHLVASALLARARLLTADKALLEVALRLGIAA